MEITMGTVDMKLLDKTRTFWISTRLKTDVSIEEVGFAVEKITAKLDEARVQPHNRIWLTAPYSDGYIELYVKFWKSLDELLTDPRLFER